MQTSTRTMMATNQQKGQAPAIIVGIDVGAESTKCVLGSSLDFEIVRNAHGGHSTPSSVQFRGRDRLLGEDAAEAKNADANTILHVGRLVDGGSSGVGDEEEDALAAFHRFQREKQDCGGCAVRVDYDGKTRTFSSAAILAMLLGKVRKCVEETVKRKLGDSAADGVNGSSKAKYVLSLAPGASEEARVAVLDAAYAAGLGDDVEVVSAAECTASVYGKKFASDSDDGNASRKVLVVDMGHGQCTASILSLGGGAAANITSTSNNDAEEEKKDQASPASTDAAAMLLSTASNASLGAGCVDMRLWHHFRDSVPGLSSLTPKSRRGQRLLDGCRRLKHLLSMLPSGNVTVETLGDNDRDVTLQASRDKIQELCKGEGEVLASLIAKVLEGAEEVESASEICSVEILGGGCRIPFFQNVILKAIGKNSGEMTLSRSLDDTSIAMGGTLLAETMVGSATSNLPIDAEKRKALFDAEQDMAKLDNEMAMLADARNKIESHVFEMRDARHGKHGSLLPEELDAHLTETDDWLFTEECDNADLSKMQAKLEEVVAKTNSMCKEYADAVKKEAREMERQMEKEAEKAKAEQEAAGDDEDDDHDNRKLKFPRRMEIVQKNKAEANELFSGKNYKHAAARYVKALSHCAKFYDLSPENEEEVKAVKLSLNLNLALAYYKMEKFENALRSCNDAINIDGDSTKALYRRASIYYELKKYDDAKKDLTKALKVAPDDVALKKLNARIEQQLKKQKVKEKKMAQKMFGAQEMFG